MITAISTLTHYLDHQTNNISVHCKQYCVRQAAQQQAHLITHTFKLDFRGAFAVICAISSSEYSFKLPSCISTVYTLRRWPVEASLLSCLTAWITPVSGAASPVKPSAYTRLPMTERFTSRRVCIVDISMKCANISTSVVAQQCRFKNKKCHVDKTQTDRPSSWAVHANNTTSPQIWTTSTYFTGVERACSGHETNEPLQYANELRLITSPSDRPATDIFLLSTCLFCLPFP